MTYVFSPPSASIALAQLDRSVLAVVVSCSRCLSSAALPVNVMTNVVHLDTVISMKRSALRGCAYSSAREMIIVYQGKSVDNSQS
jgi:hypothetical protein